MKIRVLMFGWEFPPYNSGGLGTACFGLSRALVSEGIGVTFVLPKKISVSSGVMKIIFADAASKIKFRTIDSLLTPYVTSDRYGILRSFSGTGIYGRGLFDEVFRYAVRAREVASEENFDIIHAHDWLSFPAGMEAKRVSGKPLIVHVHATEFDRTGGNGINQNVYEIEKAGMETADGVIAVSEFTKEIICRHYGIPPEKIRVVHNAIEIGDYNGCCRGSDPGSISKLKSDGSKIVIFVGRITLQKGPDYFIRAAKTVLGYIPNVYFVIAGSGDMEGQMVQEAARLGISDKVIFTGFLRGEELNEVYRSADLFVMPSVSEPFGITPLESLINGTPVLISKQSGVSEVIRHALKTDFWDVDEMANKIIAVLNHPPLRQTLQEGGCGDVYRISWRDAAEKCIGLYSELLQPVLV